jgi:hypothetical protein
VTVSFVREIGEEESERERERERRGEKKKIVTRDQNQWNAMI